MHQPILRMAFLTVVLGVVGATVLWSSRQNEAYQREAEVLERSPEPSPASLAAAAKIDPPKAELLSVVTSSGRPVRGARIYRGDWPGGYTQRLGVSDARGQVLVVPSDAGLALAPDGRITLLDAPDKIVFGPRASLRLRLTNGRGASGGGRKITIVPIGWLPSYNPMGIVDRVPNMAPELMSRLTRTTDASGTALFTGLGQGQTFQVFVHLDSERALSFDKLVRSGTRQEIMVARDHRIEGRVTRVSGDPLAGMKVELAVTNDGRFPTLTRRWAITDADGRYHFDNLLTCGYSIRLDSPLNALGESGLVDVQRGTEPWIVRTYDGPPPAGDWNANEYLRLWPKERVTRCNFRWTKAAYLDVELRLANPALQLKRIFLRENDRNVWTHGATESGHADFMVRPGTYEIYMETKRQTEERAVDGCVGKVTLAEGERKTVRVTAGR